MVGDYWEKNETTLCQACYDKHLQASTSAYKNLKWVACLPILHICYVHIIAVVHVLGRRSEIVQAYISTKALEHRYRCSHV